MNIRIISVLFFILSVMGYIGYLKLSNAHLKNKINKVKIESKKKAVEAHFEEIDLTLAEKLKNIEGKYDEPVSVEDADDNGSWSDTFWMQ